MLLAQKKRNFDVLVQCFIIRSEMVNFKHKLEQHIPLPESSYGEEGGECEGGGGVVERESDIYKEY